MKRFPCALAGGLALLALTCPGVAGPRVDSDPNKVYLITPEVGPWVICAASYTGPNARQLAREVVFQLRRRDNLSAYFFDYSEEERKRLQNYLDGRRRPGKVNIQDQCGVLIGGFADADSARKMLTEVKKLKMPDLDKKSLDAIVNPNDGKIYYMSPFANAFVTRNPTVPHEQQANNENDPALKALNAREEFSLLKNKHAWTLFVKGYRGTTIIQSGSASQSFTDKLWGGKKSNDVLGATAGTADNLAEALRSPKIGFEAYVLHTRNASFVTVGGFDSPDDPKLQETRNKLEEMRRINILKAGGTDPLQLAEVFIPMRVPKP